MPNAFDPMATFQNAQQGAYQHQQQIGQDLARRRAGLAMQSGDTQGAAGELYAGGDLSGGMAIQQQQQRGEDRQYERAQAERKTRMEDAQFAAGFMKDAATALLEVPAEQRQTVYRNSIAPRLIQMGLDESAVNQAADHLDDASLQGFGGELDKHLQVVNRGGGGYDVVDTRTGQAVRSVEPDPKMVSVANGATLFDPQTGKPVYSSPKTFAPQRPRSGGGGGGAPQAPVASRQIGGKTYYKVNGEWYDNPEGR